MKMTYLRVPLLFWLLPWLVLGCSFLWGVPAVASEDSKKLAAEIPIFDMHMHVYPGLSPSELESRMNRNNVRWGGGVGATTPQADTAPFKAQLGNRYYPTIGQPEMAAIYFQGGVGALESPDNEMLKRVIDAGPNSFAKRQAHGFGELILNNENSNPNPKFRRRSKVDSPFVRQVFTSAAQHNVIVQLHIEPHASTLNELKTLLKEFPKVPVVISHCMTVTPGPGEMEALFDAFPQVFCELSARSQTYLPRRPDIQVYGYGVAKANWIASIEKYPDRYMVGTDVTSDSFNYDEEIKQIRTGLLPRLSPATLVKVAHQNAKRLMGVAD